MRKVEQIVGQQQQIGAEILVTGFACPSWILHGIRVWNERRIGLEGIAHPYPYQARPLNRRIGFHARIGGYARLPWYFNASTVAVESQAVIHAPHAISFLAPERQRRCAVTAAVLHHYRSAVHGAIHDDRLAQDRSFEECVVENFVIPGDDVPRIADKQPGALPHRRRYAHHPPYPPTAKKRSGLSIRN
jgi:hypothetical protein